MPPSLEYARVWSSRVGATTRLSDRNGERLAAYNRPMERLRSLVGQERALGDVAWGDSPPTPELANLDYCRMGPVDVRAFPAGDSPSGCRQMIGNVWEWTDSRLRPYPGFVADPYKQYSQTYFGKKPGLRGGGWTTRSSLIRNTWRNFFIKHRRSIVAGFRTCALSLS